MHPSGNPHYNLDPEGMRIAARHIGGGLKRLRPGSAAAFDQRLSAWEADLDARLESWKQRLGPFRGAAFIEYHDTWVYFAERFGLRIVARLEPKPGLSPTPSHLAQVVARARSEQVGLIVSRPVYADVARKVAAEVGAKTATLTYSSTEGGSTRGYLAFMDHVVETFASNLHSP
jgi:ABC-type Zn uptake system ZnuABC Zn-binding protein ZnuA